MNQLELKAKTEFKPSIREIIKRRVDGDRFAIQDRRIMWERWNVVDKQKKRSKYK